MLTTRAAGLATLPPIDRHNAVNAMSTVTPSAFVYVVKLRGPDDSAPARLSGRVEHVMSGRRHDFDNGAALLECLRHEQQQALDDTDGAVDGAD